MAFLSLQSVTSKDTFQVPEPSQRKYADALDPAQGAGAGAAAGPSAKCQVCGNILRQLLRVSDKNGSGVGGTLLRQVFLGFSLLGSLPKLHNMAIDVLWPSKVCYETRSIGNDAISL